MLQRQQPLERAIRWQYEVHIQRLSATEQLFNLSKDPFELHDMSKDPESATELAKWRQRMVTQFETEGRGPNWVRGGKLMKRTQPQVYSLNYPKNARR